GARRWAGKTWGSRGSSKGARSAAAERIKHVGGPSGASSEHALGHKKNFADVFAVLDEVMGRRRFIERKTLRNLRLDGALCPQLGNLLAPAANAVYLAPHVTQIDAKNALVGVNERHWIELEPGRVRKHAQHMEKVPLLPHHSRGNAKHAKPPGRRKQAIPLFE